MVKGEFSSPIYSLIKLALAQRPSLTSRSTGVGWINMTWDCILFSASQLFSYFCYWYGLIVSYLYLTYVFYYRKLSHLFQGIDMRPRRIIGVREIGAARNHGKGKRDIAETRSWFCMVKAM